MGFRFSKRKKVGLFNISVSKKGIGISTGNKWVRFGISADGRAYATYKIPGTGISKTEYLTKRNKKENTEIQYIPDIFKKEVEKEVNIKDLKKIGKPYFDLSYGKFSLPIFATVLWIVFPPAFILSIPMYIYPIYNHVKIKNAFNKLEGKIKGSLYIKGKIYPSSIDITDDKIILYYKISEEKINEIYFDKALTHYTSTIWKIKEAIGRYLIIFHKELEGDTPIFINANPNDNKLIKRIFTNKVLTSFILKNGDIVFQDKEGIGIKRVDGTGETIFFPHRYLALANVKEIDNEILELEFKDILNEIYKFYFDRKAFNLSNKYHENITELIRIVENYPISKTGYIKLEMLLTNAGFYVEDYIHLKIKEIETFSKNKKEKINELKKLANDLEKTMSYKGAVEVYEYILTLDEKAGVKKKLKFAKEKWLQKKEILEGIIGN